MAEEVKFNGKTFLMIPDVDIEFRIYVDPEPDNIYTYKESAWFLNIKTSYFPNGLYGWGITSNIIDTEGLVCNSCEVSKTHSAKTEFEAKQQAVKYCLQQYGFNQYSYSIIKELLKKDNIPKDLFDI